jgi:hypothetical protein
MQLVINVEVVDFCFEHCVVFWAETTVSEKHAASIFRVLRDGEE